MVARVQKKSKVGKVMNRVVSAVLNQTVVDEDDSPGRGRPSGYRKEFAKQAEVLCQRFGATDADLGVFFNVSYKTIQRWRNAYPEFCLSIKNGKEVSDDRTERSLYNRANGYSYDSVKLFYDKDMGEVVEHKVTEHVPPDVTAQIFWLKNRRPDRWRDRQETYNASEIFIHLMPNDMKLVTGRS